jgi:hypothetical protein
MNHALGRFLLLPAVLAGLALVGCHSTYYDNGVAYACATAQAAAVDLNGDHRLDLLATTPGCDLITADLQSSSQAGSFLAPQHTGASGPYLFAVGPLAAGALPGLAVATDAGVTVMAPNPAQPGTFTPVATLSLGARIAQGVALGDLTGNGLADVAVAADGGSDLLVFFQQADGSFGAPLSLPVAGTPTAVAMGDLDGDGLPDLAVATDADQVSVLLQDPAHPGQFLAHVDYSAGNGPLDLKIADLENAGFPDLVVADGGTDQQDITQGLAVLLHDPAHPGAFLAATIYDVGDYDSVAVAVGDLNEDGLPDIAVANFGLDDTPGSVSVLLQDPAHPGSFLAGTVYQGFFGPQSVAIGDLNGDGLPDLVSADGDITVRYQVPGQPGTFGPLQHYLQ